MTAMFFVVREVWHAVADDFGFSLTILAWVVLAGLINSSIPDESWRSPIFLIGLLAILLLSIAFTHSPAVLSHKSRPNHTR